MKAWLSRFFAQAKPRPIKYRLDREQMEHLILGGELRIHAGNHECHLIMADVGYGELIGICNDAIMDMPNNRLCEIRNVKAL